MIQYQRPMTATLRAEGSETRRQGRLRLLCAIMLVFGFIAIGSAGQLRADDSPEDLAGFSASETYDIVPGSRLDLEEPFFVRSLYRIAKVSPESLGKFSQDTGDVSLQQMIEKTRNFRFWAFTRDATLERLTILKFPAQSEAGISGVYQAACRDKDGQAFFLLCRSAPSRIARNERLNEPIRFSGFFYNAVQLNAAGEGIQLANARLGNENADGIEEEKKPEEVDLSNVAPVFVVNRFAWYPKAVAAVTAGTAGNKATAGQKATKVSAGHVELASHGVDVGLFDYVRKRNSKPLAQQDAGCFYQMLQAATAIGDEKMESGGAEKESSASVGFVELVGAPTKHIGTRVKVTGSLRQCVRIAVPADAPVSSTGQPLRHYYQVSLFPDLGGRKVVTRTGEGEALSFDRYPVTVCLSALPSGMTPETLTGKTATVDGFFYRLIKYQSQKTEAEDQDGMVSPLVMASAIQLVSTANTARAVDGLMNAFLWLMLAAVAAVIIWKFVRWRRSVFGGSSRSDEGAFDFPDKIDASNIEDQNLS